MGLLKMLFGDKEEEKVKCVVCDFEDEKSYVGQCDKCGAYLCDDCLANEYHQC